MVQYLLRDISTCELEELTENIQYVIYNVNLNYFDFPHPCE